MNKKMIVLEPIDGKSEYGCLYLEKSVFGVVAVLSMYNFNGENKKVEIVITDSEAYSHIEKVEESCKMFNISSSFLLESTIVATIFVDGNEYMQGEVVSSCPPKNLDKFLTREENYLAFGDEEEANIEEEYYYDIDEDFIFDEPFAFDDVFGVSEYEYGEKSDKVYSAYDFARDTSQEDLLSEAKLIIDKVKNNEFSQINNDSICYEDIGKYYEIIEDDFDELFSGGEKVKSLCPKFNNSSWVKISFEKSTYFLGKVYDAENRLKYVAIGVPSLMKQKNQTLGRWSSFVKIEGYDDFCYELLVQDAESGKALRL